MDINRNNYETFFLLYLDRELDPSEMLGVEKFLTENADLQKEFALLRQTILVPPSVEFGQKELLFRKEEERKVIPMYWSRIAAAVAILFFGGWLFTAILVKKQGSEMAGTDNKKNMLPALKDNSSQKTKKTQMPATDLSVAAVKEIPPVARPNNSAIKNKVNRSTGTTKSKTPSETELSGRNNQGLPLESSNADLRNPSSAEDPDGSDLVMQKSSALALEPAESLKSADPKQITTLPGSHAPVVLITAAGSAETAKYQEALLRENEGQPDNAISVVALNDKNKAITGFFKKLTKRSPADESARKVRVSVFQFSY